MNIAACLLVLLPMVYCASIEERFVIGTHQFHLADITAKLKHALGSDATEAACEAACPTIISVIPGASLFSHLLCPAACKGIHHLASGSGK